MLGSLTGVEAPPPDGLPSPAVISTQGSMVFETREIQAQVPANLEWTRSPLVVVEPSRDPLQCPGGTCELNARSADKMKPQPIQAGLVASEAGDQVALFPFSCTKEGDCTTSATAVATVDIGTFSQKTRHAKAVKSTLSLGGERVQLIHSADLAQGIRLRAFISSLIAARRACIKAEIPDAVFRTQEWGEVIPNSFIVTYRQPLNEEFAHEVRADVSFLMAYEAEGFQKALASDTFSVHLESQYNSRRIHVPTGAHLRGFSLERSLEFKSFHDKVDSCLVTPQLPTPN